MFARFQIGAREILHGLLLNLGQALLLIMNLIYQYLRLISST